MLNILIDILAELLGGDEKRARSRRVPGRPAGGGGQPQDLESVFQDFVAQIRGEEAEPEPPAPTPPPPPRRAAQPQRRPPKARQAPQREPAPTPAPARIAPAPDAAPLRPAPDAKGSAALPEFVARLRHNPRAAREAFVYAEIFGPPLADR